MSSAEPTAGDSFEALVQRMERLARASPGAYRYRMLALATAGYLYLLAVLAVLAALLAGTAVMAWRVPLLGIKLFIIVGAVAVVVVRCLWVRLVPPEGERLTREQAPRLFALLERLRGQLRSPRIHRVLVSAELNAAIAQVPRLGIFGWHRNYLILGLPLLKCLTVEQLTAVLAHELGHVTGGHTRIGNRIYRLRRVWQNLGQALQKSRGLLARAIQAPLRWYVPYFTACSFPLARQNEYEADAVSMRLTSARAAGQALTATAVAAYFLAESYWPGIQMQARDSAQPAFAPFGGLDATPLRELPADASRRWLQRALNEPTTYADTHPSLSARLAAIGVAAELAFPAPGEAADALLGEHAARLAAAFDARWRSGVAAAWQQAHAQAQEKRVRLQALRAEAAAGATLSTQADLERASLEEHLGEGAAASLALRRAIHARDPDSPAARFALGRQLLEEYDAAGVPLVESVLAAGPQAELAAARALRRYFWEQGAREPAERWHARVLKCEQRERAAQAERDQLRPGDSFLEHGLPAEPIAALTARLQQVVGLKSAYLVRRRLTLSSEPCYVLGFGAQPARAQAVLAELRDQVPFPGRTRLVWIAGDNQRFGEAFRLVPNARLL